ncbi:MAG: glycosyltransferase [Salibacteraceae bacterium]
MKPQLSVIVCTYNRERYIKRNLESFLNQTAKPCDFEVVIINNNSPDNTDGICTDFIQNHPEVNWVYKIETNQGHTYARNRGIKESSGKYLAFIDDDAFVRRDYCENIINFYEQNPSVDCIGGLIVPDYESGAEPKWMTPYLLTLVAAQDYGNEIKEFHPRKFPIGANMVYRKSVFDKIGVFNVDLGRRGDGLEGGDEKDLIYRLREANGKIYYVPNVAVDHIIGEHRESMTYIKGMGVGVGTSERTRIKEDGFLGLLKKIIEETFKWGATFTLLFYYILRLKPIKGWTLLKFRYWVFLGLAFGKK